LSPDDFV